MDRMKSKPKHKRKSTSDPLMRSVKRSARSARAGGSAATNSIFSFSFFKLALTGGVVLGFAALFFISGVFGGTKINLSINTNSDLEDGLIGHWTFDGGDIDWASSTAELLDRSGQNNHADIVPTTADWGDTTSQSTGTTANWFRCMGGDGPSEAGTLNGIYTSSYGSGSARLAVYQGGTLSDPQAATLVWDAGTVAAGSGYVGVVGGTASLAANTVTWVCLKGNDNSFGLHYDTVHDADSDFQSGLGRWAATGLSTDETVAFESDLTGGGTSFGDFWYSFYMSYTPSDPTKFVQGRIGSAVEFDGVDDYVDLTDIDFGTGSITYVTWIKPDTFGDWDIIFASGLTGTNPIASMGLWSDGSLRSYIEGTNASQADGTDGTILAAGNWYHVVTVFDRTTNLMTRYIDGVQTGTQTDISGVTGSISAGGHTAIAAFNTKTSGQHLDGLIDDMRVYNRALSVAELTRLYQLGATTHVNTSINTNPDLENGLVLHYTFDGGDLLQNVVDRSGSGNTGYLVNFTSTTTASGRIGQALEVDRGGEANDYVTAGSDASLNGASALTYSIWMKRDGIGTGSQWPYILTSGDTHTYYGLRGSSWGANIYFEYGDSPYDGSGWFTLSSSNSLPVGEWKLFTFTYDGSTLKMYENGVYTKENNSVTLNPNINDIKVNRSGNFKGYVDDVRIYNRALSAAEVLHLYQLGATTKVNTTINTNPDLEDGLILHYTFDGPDLLQNAADRSGSGNTGYLSGFTSTTTVRGKIGQALDFDGSDDVVNFTSTVTQSTGTYAFWINYSKDQAAGDGNIISNNCCLSRITYYSVTDSWFIETDTNGETFSFGVFSIGIDEWHHVVITRAGDNASLWIDGEFKSSDTDLDANDLTVGGLGIAAGQPRFWDGYLDDVRIYNRVLSTTTIERLYDLGR